MNNTELTETVTNSVGNVEWNMKTIDKNGNEFSTGTEDDEDFSELEEHMIEGNDDDDEGIVEE